MTLPCGVKMKHAACQIQIKRVYEPVAETDGHRFLVDALWPRGRGKESLRLDGWLKEVAPSDELRKWFKHDPAKWNGFQKRYRAELSARPDAWQPLLQAAGRGGVTLLFGARDTEHNNAAVLKAYLGERLKDAGQKPERAAQNRHPQKRVSGDGRKC